MENKINNKLLKEVRRVNNLMGINKNILSEQATVVKFLKGIFQSFDDDLARKVLRATDNSQDDLIKKLKAGDSLSDEVVEKILKVMDYDLISKTIIDDKLLGDVFDTYLSKVIAALSENPNRYDDLLTKMNKFIQNAGDKKEFPNELISSLKRSVKNKIDDGIKIKYAGNRIADLGAGVFRLIPFVSRNLKAVVTILAEQRKGIEVLKKEINSLFDNVITGDESLRNIRKTLEDKLVTIERIADGGAEETLKELKNAYKELYRNGKITKVQYEKFLNDSKTISTNQFWNDFIAPNYKELDKQVDGLGSFFKNGKKAFSPLKLEWTNKNGKYGWVPKIGMNKEGIQRFFNFLAFNSAQTGSDVLKRLIKSNPPGKTGANRWIIQTYLRLIGPQLIIPFANAALWTVWIPATEWFQEGADKLGVDVDWDIFETTFSELLADLWYDNLLDIWNKDPDETTKQIELGDFRPVFKSRLLNIIQSFGNNDDYKEPTSSTTEPNELPVETTPLAEIPQDLLDAFPDNKISEIKKDNDGNYYWGEPEYKMKKNSSNKWTVLNPENGQWYTINKNM